MPNVSLQEKYSEEETAKECHSISSTTPAPFTANVNSDYVNSNDMMPLSSQSSSSDQVLSP